MLIRMINNNFLHMYNLKQYNFDCAVDHISIYARFQHASS
jgi:hypothetical protein